jgi:hypothetical protein
MLSGGPFLKIGLILLSVTAAGWLPRHTADLGIRVIDKNCWIEIFEDEDFDTDDPHVKLYGPKDFPTLKGVGRRDWDNDIESVIVGSNAMVLAYKDKDYNGREIPFAPSQQVQNLRALDMANDIESMKLSCGQ